MNGQYLSATPAEDLLPLVAPELEKLGVKGNAEAVVKAIAAVKTRVAHHARCGAPGRRRLRPQTRPAR